MSGFSMIRGVGLLLVVGALGLTACQSIEPTASFRAEHDGAALEGYLSKPEGDGPFPAVVLQHGCGGLEMHSEGKEVWRGLNLHASLLNDSGYVTLIVDSFGPRGVRTGCLEVLTYYPVLVRDSIPAFDYLASQPFVDRKRIGYLGLSLGGVSALFVTGSRMAELKVDRDYAAAVAFYPHCGNWENTYAFGERPLLILIGAKDDWTPASFCQKLAAHWADEVELVVYPGVHHSFDLPMGGPFYMEGHDGDKIVTRTVAGDAEAGADARKRMVAFFDKHMGAAR